MFEQLISLIEKNDPNVTQFDFTDQPLNDEQAQRLTVALSQNTFIQSLILKNTLISSTGIESLCIALKKTKTLRSLDLSHNPLHDEAVKKLSEVIAVNKSLETINSYYTGITPKGGEYLREALFKNFRLTHLDVEETIHQSVRRYLERNQYRANHPKIAFDDSLLEQYSTDSFATFSLDEKKNLLGTILSNLFLSALDMQIVILSNLTNFPLYRLKLSRGNPEQLDIIDDELDKLVDSFYDIEIDWALFLAGKQSHLELGNFLNFLFDIHQEALENLVYTLCNKRVPNATKQDIDKIVSSFIETLYKNIISEHKSGLIRKWISKYNDLERPIPESSMKQQTLLEKALINAAAHGDTSSVTLLLHYVKNSNRTDAQGLTALDYAQCYFMYKNDSGCFVLLKKAGAQNSNIPFTIKEKLFVEKLTLEVPPNENEIKTHLSPDERDLLIRIWVPNYRSLSNELPEDESFKQLLLERALGNAAEAGAIQDILKLIPFVNNVNAQSGPQLRTALHRAVMFANNTSDSRCFEALKNAGADLMIKDSHNKTPLDLWDFTKNPNATLQELYSPSVNQNTEFGCSVM